MKLVVGLVSTRWTQRTAPEGEVLAAWGAWCKRFGNGGLVCLYLP